MRTGIFGGAFDPPHAAHAVIALGLVDELSLDRLLVIPAACPPHRDAILPADIRLGLVRRLFEGLRRIEVSALEMERPGPSFTVDTLEDLSLAFPRDEFILAMGSDQFAALDSWKEHKRLCELATIAVIRRRGSEPVPPPSMAGIDYLVADARPGDVSGSQIRRRLEEGRSVGSLVPAAIRGAVERAWAGSRRLPGSGEGASAAMDERRAGGMARATGAPGGRAHGG